jgi:hypothetical protein
VLHARAAAETREERSPIVGWPELSDDTDPWRCRDHTVKIGSQQYDGLATTASRNVIRWSQCRSRSRDWMWSNFPARQTRRAAELMTDFRQSNRWPGRPSFTRSQISSSKWCHDLRTKTDRWMQRSMALSKIRYAFYKPHDSCYTLCDHNLLSPLLCLVFRRKRVFQLIIKFIRQVDSQKQNMIET